MEGMEFDSITPHSLCVTDPDDNSKKLGRDIWDTHVTTYFKPKTHEQCDYRMVGEKRMFSITGYGNDGKNEGISVEDASGDNKGLKDDTHITLSVSKEGMPKDTAGLEMRPVISLSGSDEKNRIVEGTFGVCLDKKFLENFNSWRESVHKGELGQVITNPVFVEAIVDYVSNSSLYSQIDDIKNEIKQLQSQIEEKERVVAAMSLPGVEDLEKSMRTGPAGIFEAQSVPDNSVEGKIAAAQEEYNRNKNTTVGKTGIIQDNDEQSLSGE